MDPNYVENAMSQYTDQYIAFLKQISLNLNEETKMFFFNPDSEHVCVFPLY